MSAEAIEVCGIVDLDIDASGEIVTVAYLRTVPAAKDADGPADEDLLALELAL